MSSAIHHLSIVRYYRERPGWDQEDIVDPDWAAVDQAIRQMENYCYPFILLNPSQHEDDENVLSVFGGPERFAVTSIVWSFYDPDGSREEVRLWESDQGYFTEERNIITDINEVLQLARTFYETASYEQLERVSESILDKRSGRS